MNKAKRAILMIFCLFLSCNEILDLEIKNKLEDISEKLSSNNFKEVREITTEKGFSSIMVYSMIEEQIMT